DLHKGVDLAARCDPVLSVMEGTVSSTGFNPILGSFIRIKHGEFQSIYGHLSYILVTPGDSVTAGQFIGITGSTGRVTGEHLHFS
ncbi:M23 family metallopeptidase, partial [Staphylococcus aureus]|nr:M23 family metallopeptidase [Staphylococcus aureus]